MKKQWYKHTIIVVLLHIAVWAMLFFFPYFIRPDIPRFKAPPITTLFGWENILHYGILAVIFYFNAYWLMPVLLNRRKYIPYILSVLAILCVAFLNRPGEKRIFRERDHMYFNEKPGPAPPRMMVMHFRAPMFPTIISLVFVLAVSNTYRFFLDKLRADKLQQERETEHLKSELSFLRSQISPHFIFNVLNSAVSLTRTKPSQVEPTLIKLSGLMRYMLYDTDDTKVPLNQEVEYLEAYVDLQRLRFGDLLQIEFSKSGSFFGYAIEPMLLIPFVENAFKHGLARVDKPSISIVLQEDHNKLALQVKNKYNPEQVTRKDKYSGIGLANVKKRLDILYGDNYNLTVDTWEEWYEIKLIIPLQ